MANPNVAADFAEKVKQEALKCNDYEFNGHVELMWMDAIKKVITEHQCPDCLYSIEKEHRS